MQSSTSQLCFDLSSFDVPAFPFPQQQAIYPDNDHSNDMTPTIPPPLQSPFQLAESSHASRSVRPSHHRRSRRLATALPYSRHCARSDCPIQHSPHPFDQLPWISSLDAPPTQSVEDIADLSQLDYAEELCATTHSPTRRRKTSLRSSPLPSTLDASSDTNGPLVPRDAFVPSTPRQKPISHVRFRNLMPIFSCDQYPSPSIGSNFTLPGY